MQSLRFKLVFRVFLLLLLLCLPLLVEADNLEGNGLELPAKDVLSINALSRLESGVQEHTLSNGLRILFYERHVAPIFAGVVSTKVGGVNEPLGKTGASHLFEHLAFKGTPEIGTTDYGAEKALLKKLELLHSKIDGGEALSPPEQTRLDELLARLGKIWRIAEFTNLYRKWGESGMNASTAKELTTYFANFPNTSFEFWCWVESERLTRPVLRQFYKERDVVIEERRARYENSPSGKLYEELLGQAFLQHPYRNPVIGYEADIRSLEPSDITALHDTYYVASNIVVTVVGDLSFKKALPLLEKYFGRVPGGKRPEGPTMVEPPQQGERTFTVTYDAEPVFFVGYKKPVFPDRREAALTLFLEVVLGSRVAPLYKDIVINKRMASDLGYFEAPSDNYPNLMVLYGEPIKPHTNAQVLAELDRGMKNLFLKPLDNDELMIAKRSIMKGALLGLKSNMGLATQLTDSAQKFGDWRASVEWYKQMLSITSEEATQSARDVFVPTGRTVGFLTREKNGEAS